MAREMIRATLPGMLVPIVLLLALVAVIVYASGKSRFDVVLSMQSSQPGRLQVFYDSEGNFAEVRSLWIDVASPGPVDSSFRVPGAQGMWLRLDPPSGATIAFCDIRMGGSGAPVQFEILRAAEVSVVRRESCLRVRSDPSARDPQFVLHFRDGSASRIAGAGWWQRILSAAWIGLIVILLRIGYLLRPRLRPIMDALPVPPGFGWLQHRAHWICAALMLVFGTAYLVVTPPGAVADEEAHLAKVIRISHGVPFGDSGTRLLPDPRVMYGQFSGYPDNKEPFTAEQLKVPLHQPLLCEPSNSGISKGANGYFPHHYLLPAAAYKVGCATGASFGWFLYVARALNLLLAMVLVAWGVACATRGKLGLLLIALLPMSLFQMSSISADSLVLSLSIAWLGVVSGIVGGSLHPGRAALPLWVLGLSIAFLKPGSAWILVCLLFCKPAYAATGRSFVPVVAKHLALPWLIHLGWTLAAAGHAWSPVGVDPAANLQALSSEPFAFLETLLRTLRDNVAWWGAMMVGVLGWLDVRLSPWAYATAGVLALAALWSNSEQSPSLDWYVRPLALSAIAMSIVLIALPLFIYWTPSGSPIIRGIQGRYFTATAAFAVVWCSFRSPPGVRAILAAVIVTGVLAINVDAIQRLHLAYFVTGR